MQHGLLALALILIGAIVAALFAPAYVDWNDWRTTFERQAGNLAGTGVRIRGPIEATILPTPAFVLRDVRIGDPEQSTGIHAGEVRGTLSLGALFRGAFEAEEFVLRRPTIRIAVERGGSIVLPGGAEKAADEIAISRFSIEQGSLTLDDRGGSGLTFFDAVSATGEMRSRTGPLRLDAALRLDGRRWNLRASAGVFGADGAARTRLHVERPDDGTMLDADGSLTFAGAAPRFNGKIVAAQPKAQGLPWKLSANAAASGESITLDGLEVSLGANEFPLELSGQLQFVPRRDGEIQGVLSTKRLDIDRALGAETGKGVVSTTAALRETIDRVAALPLRGRIGISADLLIANAGQVRDLRGEFGLRSGFAGIETMEAKLPGRASLRATSGGNSQGYFSGDVLLEAEEPAALLRWALGPEKSDALEDAGALRIGGRAEWTPKRIVAERLDFQLGDARLGGSFSFAHDAGRGALQALLTSDGVDLDLLRPLGETLWTASKDSDVRFGFQGSALKFSGKEIKRLEASLTRDASGVSVERLTVGDFDGLSGKASGKLSGEQGKLTFEIEAARPGGMIALAQEFAGDDGKAIAEHLTQKALPLKFTGEATGGGGKPVDAAMTGRLGSVNADIRSRIDTDTASLEQTRIVLEAGEAGRLLSLLGISPGLPAPGDGRLEVRLEKAKAGTAPVEFTLSVPGSDLSGMGEISNSGDRLAPRISLKLEAGDLRPALAAASRAGSEAIPAKGSATLSRADSGFRFDDLSLEIGRTRAAGSVTLGNLANPSITGKLSLDRAELSDLLAVTFGSTGDPKSLWPNARPGVAPLSGAEGAIELAVAALGLAGAQVATAVTLQAKFGSGLEISKFAADYAGGKLTGDARITRGDTISLDARGSISGFEIARVLVPGTWKANVRGKGSLTLALSGSGATPAMLASKLSGQGTLALESLEIDEVDPLAIATVVSAAEKFMPKDEGALIAGVNKMLARAPLKISKLEAPLVAASGSVRTGRAITKAGDVDVTAEASFDLSRVLVDGSLGLETAGLTTARPGITVRWRGPAASPARLVDVSALSTAINLRAMERETKRIEQRDRSDLPPVLAPALAPDFDEQMRLAGNRAAEEITGAAMAKLPKRVPLPPLRP